MVIGRKEVMILNTKNFGEIEVREEDLIEFEYGIPGFENMTKFVILGKTDDDNSPFFWLQSAQNSNLAFVIMNPRDLVPDYEVEIDMFTANLLKFQDENDALIYAIVTVPEDISKIVDLIKTMDSLFIKIFPFLIPAAKALTTSNVLVKLLWLLLFLVINSLFVALFAIVCQKPYYKTLKESDNHGGKKKKFSKEELSSYSSSSSTFKSLVVTEWRTIVRSPAFFSNTIMAVLLVPIIMVVAFAVAFEVEGGSQGFGFSALIQDLQNQSLGNSIALLAILAILLFLCSMNMTSSSAVSRMGKSASFIKTIPVKASTIVYSKLFIVLITYETSSASITGLIGKLNSSL